MLGYLREIAARHRHLRQAVCAAGVGAALGLSVLLSPSTAAPASAQQFGYPNGYKCSVFLYCGNYPSIYYDYADQATYRNTYTQNLPNYSLPGFTNPTYYLQNGVLTTNPYSLYTNPYSYYPYGSYNYYNPYSSYNYYNPYSSGYGYGSSYYGYNPYSYSYYSYPYDGLGYPIYGSAYPSTSAYGYSYPYSSYGSSYGYGYPYSYYGSSYGYGYPYSSYGYGYPYSSYGYGYPYSGYGSGGYGYGGYGYGGYGYPYSYYPYSY